MQTVVLGEPPAPLAEWLARRRELGQDLFDEVWEGVYHVAPAPHRRHGDVDDQIAALLRPLARQVGLWPSGPLNVGEPDDYRVPDRSYLRDRHMDTFVPTAAAVVEIVSPEDETFAKFPFYVSRGIEELLIVDPQASSVQWYRRDGHVAGHHRGGSDLLAALLAACGSDDQPHHWDFGAMPARPGLGDQDVADIVAWVRAQQRAAAVIE